MGQDTNRSRQVAPGAQHENGRPDVHRIAQFQRHPDSRFQGTVAQQGAIGAFQILDLDHPTVHMQATVFARRQGIVDPDLSLSAATEQLRGLRRTINAATTPPALLMTNSFSSALEARLGGFSPSGYAHEGRSLFLRHAYRQPSFAHAAHSYWHLAGSFLGTDEPFPKSLGWTPSEAQRKQAQALLAQHSLAPESFVVLCPFSGPDDRENLKVWPGFKELAVALQAAGLTILLCPGPNEETAAAALANAISLPNVDLGVYGALFELARCVVANDTGPGHLAAAAGARLISLYGPHSVAAWTPIGPSVQLFHDVSWPTVDSVAAAVLAAK